MGPPHSSHLNPVWVSDSRRPSSFFPHLSSSGSNREGESAMVTGCKAHYLMTECVCVCPFITRNLNANYHERWKHRCVTAYCYQDHIIIGHCVCGLTQIHLATQYGHHFVDEHLMQFKSESSHLLLCNREAAAHSGGLSPHWMAPRSVNHWTKCALD